MSLQRPIFIEDVENALLDGTAPIYNPLFIPTGLYSWGNNTSGALGIGSPAASLFSSPNLIAGDWNQVSAAANGGAGLKSDTTLWAWGANTNGQLGVGDVVIRSSPVQVTGSWLRVRNTTESSGAGVTYALKSDSTLWAWGSGGNGVLGQSSTTPRSSPVQIPGAWTKEFVVTGSGNLQAMMLRADGTVWGVGNTPVVGQVSSPVLFLPAAGWKRIEGGEPAGTNNVGTFILLKNDNTMWAFGRGDNGSRGDGINVVTAITVPVQLTGTWAQISFGGHGAAIKLDGSLWMWGTNTSGQLGLGDIVNRSSPTQVAGTWIFVSCGVTSTLGIKSDNTLWGWGDNTGAQLSQGTTASAVSSPVLIPTGTWQAISSSNVVVLGKK